MKPSAFFKTACFTATIATAFVIGSACNNNSSSEPKTEDSAQVAAQENDAKFESKKLENDAQFLVDAAALNLEEIKLGLLAIQRGTTADVRNLGKMMVNQHTKSLKEVTDLAKTKQVTVPDTITNDAQDTYKMLSSKSGNEFNKAFCDRLVEGHKTAVGKFEKTSADSRDQEIKQWAATKLPELRMHLDSVFAVQKKIEKL